MCEAESIMERENRYIITQERNKALERENRALQASLRKAERATRDLRRFIDKLQEAIVNQALLLSLAMEYGGGFDDEAEQD